MRKTLRYALAGCVLVGGVVIVVPALVIDKTAIKSGLAKATYEATGRDLDILGDIGFSLLPTPRFTAERLRLANWRDSAEPWMADVAKVTVTVSPWDLLRGRVVIRHVDVDSPRILLERRNGAGNWNFLPPGQLPSRPDVPASVSRVSQRAYPTPVMAGIAGTTIPLSFDKIVIRNGTLTYRDGRDGPTQHVGNIGVTVEAQALTGPYLVQGRGTYGGQVIETTGEVGQIQTGRAVPLRFDVAAAASQLTADGLLLRETDVGPVLKGAIHLKSPDIGASIARLGGNAPVLAGQALSLTGQVRIGETGGQISDGVMRVGSADAELYVKWGHENDRLKVSAKAQARRLDLDAWQQVQAAANVMPDASARWAVVSMARAAVADDVAAVSNLLLQRLPDSFDVDVQATADAVVWRGQALQSVLGDVALSRGDFVINQLSADLPGAAQVRVFGFVGGFGAARSADLTVQAQAANTRAVMQWLGHDPVDVPSDRLRRANLSGAVRIGGDGLWRFRDVDLVLDATRAKGAADLRWAARPAIGISVSLDQLNWDAYRQVTRGATVSGISSAPMAGARPLAVPATAVAETPLWNRFDANLDFKAGRMTVGGQPMDSIALRGTLRAGRLDVATLSTAVGAAGHVSGKGGVDFNPANGPVFDHFALDLATPRADRLLLALMGQVPSALATWRNLSSTVSLDGPMSALDVQASADVSGVQAALVGRFDAVQGLPAGDGELAITAPNLGTLAAVFGASVAPELAAKGGVEVFAPIQSDASGFTVPNLAVTAGDITIKGRLGYRRDGIRPVLDVNLTGNMLPVMSVRAQADVPRWVRLAAATTSASDASQSVLPANATPWTVLRDFDGKASVQFDAVSGTGVKGQDLRLEATLNQGILNLDTATLRLWGGDVSATGQADVRARPKVSGAVDVKNVKIDPKSPAFAGNARLSGTVTAKVDGEAHGETTDALLRSLNGKGQFLVRDGSFSGADLGEVNTRLARIRSLQDVVAALNAGSRGRTAFNDVQGTFVIVDGQLRSDDIRLNAPSGKGTAQGVAQLSTQRIDATVRYALASLGDAPPLGVRLQGDWASPRIFFDAGDFQKYMFSKGLGSLLKSLGRKEGASAEPPAPKSEGLKPKDVLREVLQAIPAR